MKYLDLVKTVDQLNDQYKSSDTASMLTGLMADFPDMVMVSSFGTESAVLLHIVSKVNSDLPIVFIDTGKLFSETMDYQKSLQSEFRLNNVRIVKPRQDLLQNEDPNGTLHSSSPNECCFIRKVEPLSRALEGTTIWISGRKRYQSQTRSALSLFELEDMRIKVNPMAIWSPEQIRAYFSDHQLPEHPLLQYNYLSVGCAPCTTPVLPGEDPRSGRWRGQGKTECGIHGRTAKKEQADRLTEI